MTKFIYALLAYDGRTLDRVRIKVTKHGKGVGGKTWIIIIILLIFFEYGK